MKVSLTGRIDNRQYDAKDGTKKYISEIIADTVVPFTDRKSVDTASTEIDNTPAQDANAVTEDKVEDIVIPDEMPF